MWTTVSDVSDRWIGGGLPSDETQVITLLQDAEDTITQEFPDIQDRIDAGSMPIERVKKVAANMVIRFLRNPTGQRSQTQGAGPFQQSVTYGGDNPGALSLTDAERRILAGPKSLHGKAYAADMLPADYMGVLPDTWWPIWTTY